MIKLSSMTTNCTGPRKIGLKWHCYFNEFCKIHNTFSIEKVNKTTQCCVSVDSMLGIEGKNLGNNGLR